MKKLCSAILALALAVSLAVPAAAAFTDIPAGSSLASEVEKANSYGLMGGYNADTFGYGDSMTRAQFVTVLGRMMGWINTGAASNSDNLGYVTDAMDAKSLYGEYWVALNRAVEHDVVDTDAPFRPGAAVTRGEMSEMLVRALGLKGAAATVEKQNTLPFTDVTDRAGYIAVAYQIGMTNGTGAATFSPDATATRAQAAAMLVRIYEKLRQPAQTHAFYAISAHSQLGLTDGMSRVSAGWSRMTWDGTAALLSTTSANGNEYAIPSGYEEVTAHLDGNGTPLNLSVFMDLSGGVKELLASEAGRTQAVEQIVSELTVSYNAVGKNPYDGVTIDFEGLRSAQKADFTAFLTALAEEVHGLGKTLYVCVSPVLTTGGYYDGYDYRAIGRLADKVILMAYDYDARDMSAFVGTDYYKTAAPAPMDQVYASLLAITDANTGVADRSKILLGVSSKSVAWEIDESGKLVSGTPVYPSNETVWARMQQPDTTVGWSTTYQMSYMTYTAEGTSYFLWTEDARSVAAKLNAAKLLGITGVSLWRLGTIPTMDGWNWNGLLN